jgi:asparagine synthase (glutamine-hydrolysing)
MIVGGEKLPDVRIPNIENRSLTIRNFDGIYLAYRFPSWSVNNGVHAVISGELDTAILHDPKSIPVRSDGLFSAAMFDGRCVYLARDVIGGHPLYYVTKPLIFCSFRQPLIEFGEIKEVKPGEVIKVDLTLGKVDREWYDLKELIHPPRNVDEDLLRDDIVTRISDMAGSIERAAVAFSGGVDSSLIASLTPFPLISITGSEKDKSWLEKAGKMLEKDVLIRMFGLHDVENVIQDVVRIVETPDPLQVSIALPIYLLSEFAKDMGFENLFLGQGADEMFGGYKRYVDTLLQSGYDELRKKMDEDVLHLGENNLIRDLKVSYAWEINFLTPFLSMDIIRIAMGIPPQWKLKKVNDTYIRKYIFRRVADKILPREIAWREKRAIQYSTHAMKFMRKIARKDGLRLKEYLERIYNDNR